MKIDELHELDDEIRNLQENYNRALNYIVALRIDKSNLLKSTTLAVSTINPFTGEEIIT